MMVCIVVVIDQADELTREAQAALRRTMEKYTTNLRLILCCNSLSKLIAPLRSRCLILRVPRPTLPEVTSMTSHMTKLSSFSHRSPPDYNWWPIKKSSTCQNHSLKTLDV